ncbi:MAG: rRNA maturation RNase YbeY [Cyanobacteriota bacterium]|jgi:probable rRNA maturation factor
MSPHNPAASDPAASKPAASDLDLAFSSDDDLAEELLNLAGPLADPLAGADLWHERLSAWLDDLQADLPEALQSEAYSLGLQLVSDASIAALNQDWRSTSGATDVLAFAAQDDDLEGALPMPLPPQPEGPGPGNEPDEQADDDDWGPAFGSVELGDIVISLDTAARQAPEHGHSLEQELLFLASHGLLHLLGWDHPDDASLAAMLARQEELLAAGQSPAGA